jgi:hypothetical protein
MVGEITGSCTLSGLKPPSIPSMPSTASRSRRWAADFVVAMSWSTGSTGSRRSSARRTSRLRKSSGRGECSPSPHVPTPEIVGADKGYDTRDFVEALRLVQVTPHVAQNTSNRSSAIDSRAAVSCPYRARAEAPGLRPKELSRPLAGCGFVVPLHVRSRVAVVVRRRLEALRQLQSARLLPSSVVQLNDTDGVAEHRGAVAASRSPGGIPPGAPSAPSPT